MEFKRLFFAVEVIAPWPDQFPNGRILLETDRHLTLAFLGDVDVDRLQLLFSDFPKPSFSIGLAGIFDQVLFLPRDPPHVAAWHIQLLEQKEEFLAFQKVLSGWLEAQGFSPKDKNREFLSHMTIARQPFVLREWKETFQKLPLFLKDLRLCESLGDSKYKVLWNQSILAPFDSIEHTADLAFRVRGTSFSQLHLHAQLSLSFHFPPLIQYFSFAEVSSLEQIISSLNRIIAQVDTEIGCPFKAVSFHGDLWVHDFLEWEMIVDV